MTARQKARLDQIDAELAASDLHAVVTPELLVRIVALRNERLRLLQQEPGTYAAWRKAWSPWIDGASNN
jgi:hypothetical protein